MVRLQLIGNWDLVSCEFREQAKPPHYPFGEGALGRLTYDPTGRMSVQIMQPDRPPLAGGHDPAGPSEEVLAAFTGYLAYFGRYEVDEQEKVIRHSVEGSLLPNWVGFVQQRFFYLAGDRLVLESPPFTSQGKEVIARLEWQRLI
jgi:hypothetical protein